jgi:RNA polymerase sigma factor (sigma-70 family)
MELREFKISVLPLRNKLYRFAKRFVENSEEAEDVVQEVFIKLWNRREKLDEYRSIEALAMITTRNLCLDKLKSRKFKMESLDRHMNDVPQEPGEPESVNSDLISKINLIIRDLPEQQRAIVHLRDIEGYDYAEIAKIVGMNENAIRVNLSRARKKIRDVLTTQKIYEYHGN